MCDIRHAQFEDCNEYWFGQTYSLAQQQRLLVVHFCMVCLIRAVCGLSVSPTGRRYLRAFVSRVLSSRVLSSRIGDWRWLERERRFWWLSVPYFVSQWLRNECVFGSRLRFCMPWSRTERVLDRGVHLYAFHCRRVEKILSRLILS